MWLLQTSSFSAAQRHRDSSAQRSLKLPIGGLAGCRARAPGSKDTGLGCSTPLSLSCSTGNFLCSSNLLSQSCSSHKFMSCSSPLFLSCSDPPSLSCSCYQFLSCTNLQSLCCRSPLFLSCSSSQFLCQLCSNCHQFLCSSNLLSPASQDSLALIRLSLTTHKPCNVV